MALKILDAISREIELSKVFPDLKMRKYFVSLGYWPDAVGHLMMQRSKYCRIYDVLPGGSYYYCAPDYQDTKIPIICPTVPMAYFVLSAVPLVDFDAAGLRATFMVKK